jgi:hypothetical protein
MSERPREGVCFVCLHRGTVYPTKVRGRTLLLCEKHREEFKGH